MTCRLLVRPRVLRCRRAPARAEHLRVRRRNGPRLRKELGGDKVKVYIATTALQDPHRIEARPSLIARARSADLVVCTGAELEVGWLPLVLIAVGQSRRSSPASPAISRHRGFVDAARKTGAPRSLARRRPSRRAIRISISIRATSPRSRPRWASAWRSSTRRRRRTTAHARKAFLDRWQRGNGALGEGGARRSRACRGRATTSDLTYLIAWLGMREVGSAGAEARAAAEHRASQRAARAAQAGPGQGGRALRLQRSASPPNGLPRARGFRRCCCRSRSAAATRRRIFSDCSTTRWRGC